MQTNDGQAVKIIRALEDKDLNIELVEQPVKYWNLEEMKYVTQNTHTKILADESVFSPLDALKIIYRVVRERIFIFSF